MAKKSKRAISMGGRRVLEDPGQTYRKAYLNPHYRMGPERHAEMVFFLSRLLTFRKSYCDVGCGRGETLEYAKSLGVDAWGYELHGVGLEGESTRCLAMDDITSIGATDKQFDVVSCLDVLEHLPEPKVQAALAELWRITRQTLLLSIAWFPHETFHLTIQPPEWWSARLAELGGVVQRYEMARTQHGWWRIDR